jgi:SAM-dependent methyltransferase
MAKRRGIETFLVKGEEQFFDEESFGTVFLIVTLCFVDSPTAVLREAYRILKPEGIVILGVVLRGSPWGKFYLIRKQEGHRFYKHAVFYSYKEVERLLTDSGFIVEKIVSTLFQKPGAVKEMETPIDGFSSEAGFTIVVAKKIPNPKEG